MVVEVRRSTAIRPASPAPERFLWASNMDLVVPQVYVPTVYFYRKPEEASAAGFFDASVLEEALEQVLVPFYPLAGRLRRDGGGRVAIDCNDEGAVLVEAEDDHDFAGDFREFVQTEDAWELIPKVDCSKDISSVPLLHSQITRFRCGTVALGVRCHHALADGFSAFHFLTSWADKARGADAATPPLHGRTLLRARSPPSPSFEHVEYSPPPSLDPPPASAPVAPCSCTFEFTRAQLDELKAASGVGRCSSYVALAAHVWRCVCLARALPPRQQTKLYIAVDGRARLRPELPRGYFGNAIFTATPMAESGELTTVGGPAMAAQKISKALERMDDEYLRSAIDYLELQPDLSKLVRGAHTYRSPNLSITSWARLPMNDLDFGWGRPAFAGTVGSPCEGRAVVLPGAKGDVGSLSLSVALQPEHMDRFRELVYTELASIGRSDVRQVPNAPMIDQFVDSIGEQQ